MVIGHFYIFFGKMPVKILCQFLIGSFIFPLLSGKSSLLYSRYKPLIGNMTTNIFSYSRGCLFAFLMVGFFFFSWIKTCKKFLILHEAQFTHFGALLMLQSVLWCHIKKLLPNPRS